MKLLTGRFPAKEQTVSLEGGVCGAHFSAALDLPQLSKPVEWSEFCYACQRSTVFVALGICANGYFGECSGCGDERVAPFTRMNSEVA